MGIVVVKEAEIVPREWLWIERFSKSKGWESVLWNAMIK